MEEPSLSPLEAARVLGVSEAEAGKLAGADGRVSLAAVVLELARGLAGAREEVGRSSGQLKEVRAANARLQQEVRAGVEERRGLTEEVLELRAASEERLMLMERIERIAGIEDELAEARAELERLRSRGLIERLLNR